MASGMARLGAAPHIIEKALNHATVAMGPVAAIYNRYGYLAEKRFVFEQRASEVKRITDAKLDG